MQVDTVAEQLFFVTVLLRVGSDDASWTGTGFLFVVETNRGSVHVLVTNKHVLQGASRLEVRLIKQKADGTPTFGQTVTGTWNDFGPNAWLGHPDNSVDVAILPFSNVLNLFAEQGDTPFFRSIPETLVPGVDELEKLDALERVIFVGYPVGLFDTANFTPIARQGMTATPINLDYRGTASFLIDASVYPGSSGSPVFLLDRGIYTTRDGGSVVGSRVFLLGVLAAMHLQSVEGEIVEEPSALLVRIPQAIDLGIVFKSSTINECIDLLLQQAGFSRAALTDMAFGDHMGPADEGVAATLDSPGEGTSEAPEDGGGHA